MTEYEQLIEFINSVKVEYDIGIGNIQLLGDKKSFDKLKELGFPLDDFKYYEIPSCLSTDELTVYIVPTQFKPLKIIYEDKDTEYEMSKLF